MKRRIFLILTSLLMSLTAMVSCTDDGGTGKIQLGEGQASSISFSAGQTPGEIRFTAAAAWSAYTQTTPAGGVGEVEWLHVDTRNGSAGDAVVTFTLDANRTGASRTAYIVIICEDQKVVIAITQTADDYAGEEPDKLGSGTVEITKTMYYNQSADSENPTYFPETHTCLIEYQDGKPLRMVSRWREDLNSNSADSYCMAEQTWRFTWSGSEVVADCKTVNTYYPSGKVVVDEESRHYARLADGRVVEGNYKWSEDDKASDWTAAYDASGYLLNTRNNDGTTTWDKSDFTWGDGNVKSIKSTSGGVVTITYADPALLNLHRQLDLNWIVPSSLEYYDFAAGDVTRVFASFGLLGHPSKHLATEISENDGYHTWSCRMTYKENSAEKTVVTVSGFVNGRQSDYAEWEIKYNNIK
ncbi:MAG: hypothetical protein K2G12_06615 [Prevotella sp.]|nr:hypothetical protein [Prevotella sp.]